MDRYILFFSLQTVFDIEARNLLWYDWSPTGWLDRGVVHFHILLGINQTIYFSYNKQ